MRIKELHLNNWQVIRQANLENLSDFVVIAGPNGVGKTKIKDSILYIFQNNGSPPPNCRVTLQATSPEELSEWKNQEIALPQGFMQAFLNRSSKRLRTKSRLIQIDSSRGVETVDFQQLTFQAIGDPEAEDIASNYGFASVKDRFKDICRTLHRIKSREVTSVYKEYTANLAEDSPSVTLNKLKDPTETFLKAFGELLYPKTMLPIDINSSTIQYKDEDGQTRPFAHLSSGEREVVVLVFDLLTQHPADCLILIDEPEMHLHPELTFRLIKVLKTIGERNQYFLFTHSPDIIGNSLDTGVHFVRPKSRVPQGNQVVRVDEANIQDLKNIPNIRETIGIISVGKKLLFVEGNSTSIDRNVFATIAKSAKTDIAIVPSDSCTNVTNMTLVCDTLEKGLFGVDLFMVRDRDGLTDEQIATFRDKSKGRLIFLPFYHIENAFLSPQAIAEVAKKILLGGAPSINEIEKKMISLATEQINHTATLYVKAEIYFKAGNFDISPRLTIDKNTRLEEIATAINVAKDRLLTSYNTDLSEAMIRSRLAHWHAVLAGAVRAGWSEDARKYFIGKRLLKQLQAWLVGSKNIVLWEHVVNAQTAGCIAACAELRRILDSI